MMISHSEGHHRMREVAFASCYIYSPAGVGPVCERSRLLRQLLKAGDPRFMARYALQVYQQSQDRRQLAGFFRPDDVLVPVPGSAPKSSAARWVAADLADVLAREGLGVRTWRGLHRVRAVHKSGTAARGTRPTVALHYESLLMDAPREAPQSVVLVDDVVTKGRTLLAAAARVREVLPNTRIRAFALLRTMGLIAEVQRLLEPCCGKIIWKAGDAFRNP
jgi:predicted amidophosphoribosyltransferase